MEACDRYCAHGVGTGGGELPESEACYGQNRCFEPKIEADALICGGH